MTYLFLNPGAMLTVLIGPRGGRRDRRRRKRDDDWARRDLGGQPAGRWAVGGGGAAAIRVDGADPPRRGAPQGRQRRGQAAWGGAPLHRRGGGRGRGMRAPRGPRLR